MRRKTTFSAKAMGDLSASILTHLGSGSTSEALITSVVLTVQKSTMMDSVGVRLADGPDFPYYFTRGFDQDFVKTETRLCARDQFGELSRDSDGKPGLECMCGNVIRGRTDSSLPFFTDGGSFWTNSTTDLLASTPKEDMQSRTRNRCNSAGYESVALIPVRSGDECLGLLQLNDRRKNIFSEKEIVFLEGVTASIGLLFSMSMNVKKLISESAAATHCAEERGKLLEHIVRTLSTRKCQEQTSKLEDSVKGKIDDLAEDIEAEKDITSSCFSCESANKESTRPGMKHEWFFCPACRRTFQSEVPEGTRPGQATEEIGQLWLDKEGNDHWTCPLEDCNGAAISCLRWSVLRQVYPELPEVPIKGTRYP